jgi:hypothetical protein
VTSRRARLEGWKQIAAFLRVSLRQARRLASARIADQQRLPVFRLMRGPASRVCAYTDALEAWEERIAAANGVTTRD